MAALAASAPATTDEEQIPPLLPPRGPIAPGVWEQYGFWIVAGCVVLLVFVGIVIWLLLRPKPGVVTPPETQARRQLEGVREEPETGMLLSKVSQIVRSYFGAAFALPPGQLTTTEFCRALDAAPAVGPELREEAATFLRKCDERKFSPAPPSEPMGAVGEALQVVAHAEARRAQMRAAAQATQADKPGQSPPVIPTGPESKAP